MPRRSKCRASSSPLCFAYEHVASKALHLASLREDTRWPLVAVFHARASKDGNSKLNALFISFFQGMHFQRPHVTKRFVGIPYIPYFRFFFIFAFLEVAFFSQKGVKVVSQGLGDAHRSLLLRETEVFRSRADFIALPCSL